MKIALLVTITLIFQVVSAGTVTRLPDYLNSVQGTCKDLRSAASVGVKDHDNYIHPGACGYTQVKFSFDGLDFEDYFNAVAEKQIEPFEITTYQDETGRKCARATGVNVALTASAQVSYLDWLHNKPVGSKCANEWDRLKKIITEHESKHVDGVRPVVSAAEARFKNTVLTSCVSNGDPKNEILEKALFQLKDIALAMKKDWDAHANDLDSAGDLCDINCCPCNDHTCYAGTFTAATNSSAPVTFKDAKGMHIEMSLVREDKDSQGRVIQQFYTLERGEFVYPKIVSIGEFDCTLTQTTFPLSSSNANLTIFFNNPNFPKNSYSMGFSIEGNPVGNCYLRSDPKVTMTMPLFPFNFGFLTNCSQYKTESIKIPGILEGSFPNTCAGYITTLDWNFTLSN